MMMKKLQQFLLLISLLVMFNPANAQKSSQKSATIKNLISVSGNEPSYFTIQVLALKEKSKDVAFFKAFDSAREIYCADGYYRYIVGKYASKEEAQAAVEKIRALGVRYEKAYVVNTGNFQQNNASKNSDEKPQASAARTGKKIVLTDKITEPYFAIQILAMKVAPQDPNFFDKVDEAREFACQDGWTRWTVGQYKSKEDAAQDLDKTRNLSPKYKSAFVVNTQNYKLASSAFSEESVGTRTDKKIIPSDKLPNGTFTIQVIALRFPPQDALFFDKLDQAMEVSCTDGMKRYLVGAYKTKEEAADDLAKIRAFGPKYKNAFIVATQNIKIDVNAFSRDFQTTHVNKAETSDIKGKIVERLTIVSQTEEKTTQKATVETTTTKSMRTTKKIIPVEKATEPYYTVQLLALKDAPQDANFFDGIENAREFSCKDGYKRYVVGQFKTAEEAAEMVAKIRSSNPNFEKAFVANTSKYEIEESSFQSHYADVINNTPAINNASAVNNAPVVNVTTKTSTRSNKPTVTRVTEETESPTPTAELAIPKSTTKKAAETATSSTRSNKPTVTRVTEEAESPTPTAEQAKPKGKIQKAAETATSETKETAASTETNSNIVKESGEKDITFDPDKIYTIQVTASRYPFYTSELKDLNEVFEFYMPDKVYRYTVGKYRGESAKTELIRILNLGYKEAFIVEWDKYSPYIIE